jgi:DNA repair protein RecN (Recombination protein N)
VLEELRLRDLGVIADAVLEFGPGFTAITGETGAGKTMVLTGLSLVFGGRADSGLVRSGGHRTCVDARINIAQPPERLAVKLEEAAAELDDGALIVSRTVGTDGRSRAQLGGRPVPVGVLTELADDLVAVHGQADQRGLLRPAVQRAVLDRFAGEAAVKAHDAYRRTFDGLATVRAELREVTDKRRERVQEADALRHALAEISAVAPQSGEDVALAAEGERLGHVDLLVRASSLAHEALGGAGATDDVAALSLLAQARRALDEARGKDAALDALNARLAELAYLLSDLSADLASYRDGLEADPTRLEQVQSRRAQLTALTRKYAADIDGVLAWAEAAQQRMSELDGDDERLEQLSRHHGELVTQLAAAAASLSSVRRESARRLESAISAELSALAMSGAQVSVAVTDHDDPNGLPLGDRTVAFGPHGIDDVALLLAAHAGAPPRPLHKGASGGELSRVMLAIEVVLAGSDPVPTFVFDEVDAGVGGQAAVEVGRRLAMLARTAQVIVVTHLPQVAAFADHHLVVRKSDDGSVTTTDVRRVDDTDRLEELSRMLAGMADSELGRGHAQELLAVVSASKQGG